MAAFSNLVIVGKGSDQAETHRVVPRVAVAAAVSVVDSDLARNFAGAADEVDIVDVGPSLNAAAAAAAASLADLDAQCDLAPSQPGRAVSSMPPALQDRPDIVTACPPWNLWYVALPIQRMKFLH
mmetsp:Transcript_8832/g.17133  ORF Transcript_8832/g.17133 Transcript_8832/m.17133 type:complete len:125 (+) Transcript_8832:1335-1709(+)